MIYNDYFKQFTDLQSNMFGPVTQYQRIATKLTEELTNNSVRTLTKVMEDYQNTIKAYGDVRKLEDFLAIQTALTEKTTQDVLEASQNCSKIVVGAIADMNKVMQENYAKAGAPFKQATTGKEKN